MALEGNLEEFNIVAVLQTIASGSMAGTLHVREANNRAVVSFVEGQIIHAQSTEQQDRLGEILVRTRRISQDHLDKAVAYQLRQETGKRLGQILVDARLISRDDLIMAVQIQILEVMSQLLLWSRGQWRFDFGPPQPGGITPDEAMSIDEILSGQVLLIDNLEPAADRVAALQAVYGQVPGRSVDPTRITLERDSWRVLGAVDSSSPVADLAHRIGLDPDRVIEIMSDLLAVGLVTQLGSAPATSESGLVQNTPDSASLPAPPAPAPPLPPATDSAPGATVINPATLERVNDLLRVLLTRTDAPEVCLIDSSGSLITRQGRDMHHPYPTLFALAASIFASWQELGRSLGESKTSTLLYQGTGLNICLTPVASRAILMTLYQSASDSGLVNFWSREASTRLVRLFEEAAPLPPSPGAPPPPPVPSSLPADYRTAAGAAMDILFGDH